MVANPEPVGSKLGLETSAVIAPVEGVDIGFCICFDVPIVNGVEPTSALCITVQEVLNFLQVSKVQTN